MRQPLASPPLALAAWLGAVVTVPLFLGGDRIVALAVHERVDPAWRPLLKALSSLGNATGYVLATLLAASLLWLAARRASSRERARCLLDYARYGYLLLASLAVSGLAVGVLKPLVGRLRPKYLLHEGVYGVDPLNLDIGMTGFPSGHSQTAWVVATVLVLLAAHLRQAMGSRPLWPPRWGSALRLVPALAISVATLVAVSRVLLNDHFVSDVLAGSLLGAVTTLWLAPRLIPPPRQGRKTSRACRSPELDTI
jgi:membrane-associated phospholipid phosphatase